MTLLLLASSLTVLPPGTILDCQISQYALAYSLLIYALFDHSPLTCFIRSNGPSIHTSPRSAWSSPNSLRALELRFAPRVGASLRSATVDKIPAPKIGTKIGTRRHAGSSGYYNKIIRLSIQRLISDLSSYIWPTMEEPFRVLDVR